MAWLLRRSKDGKAAKKKGKHRAQPDAVPVADETQPRSVGVGMTGSPSPRGSPPSSARKFVVLGTSPLKGRQANCVVESRSSLDFPPARGEVFSPKSAAEARSPAPAPGPEGGAGAAVAATPTTPEHARTSGAAASPIRMSPRSVADARSPAPLPDGSPASVLLLGPAAPSPLGDDDGGAGAARLADGGDSPTLGDGMGSATPDSGHSTGASTASGQIEVESVAAMAPGPDGADGGPVSPDPPAAAAVSSPEATAAVGSPTSVTRSPSPPMPPGEPPTRLFVSHGAGHTSPTAGPVAETIGAGGGSEDDDNDYLQVDGVETDDESVLSPPEATEGHSSPLRSILDGTMGSLNIPSIHISEADLETQLAELEVAAVPLRQKSGKAKEEIRLSAADTIALYLTEKKYENNPFGTEMREFDEQLTIFMLCTEPMLEQFKLYVDAEESAAVKRVEEKYNVERIKIMRLLRAAEIAAADSPVSTPISSPSVEESTTMQANGPLGVVDIMSLGGREATAAKGQVNECSESGEPSPISPISVEDAIPNVASTPSTFDVPATDRDEDVTPMQVVPSQTENAQDEYLDRTVRVEGLAAAMAIYGVDADADSEDDGAGSAQEEVAESGSPKLADAALMTSKSQPPRASLASPEYSASVRVVDLDAVRQIYGMSPDRGARADTPETAAATKRDSGKPDAEMWNAELGKVDFVQKGPPARRQTVWVKPGSTEEAELMASVTEREGEATPTFEEGPSEVEMEEDIPEEISPQKQPGWL
mmetsp:Transcript_8583/g.22142  ORF Transcript_8583/g.22142 Transcript_8583/m.22142 type:complete len:765 (+) Transcript_8583:133-2427(+)